MSNCSVCNRSFGSRSALNQHMKSPVHTPDTRCVACDKKFNSKSALDQHMNSAIHVPRDSPILTDSSPLDLFFCSFPKFQYTPSNPPQEEYRRLRQRYDWKRNDPDGEDAWSNYRSALVREFNRWYGEDDSNMDAWQSLCRAIGVLPLPQTLKDCKTVSAQRQYVLLRS